MKINHINILKSFALLASATALISLNSCSSDPLSPGIEFMPDMYRSVAYKPYEENPNFKDMLGARPPVQGTISQGEFPNSDISMNELIYPYPNSNEGYELAGKELINPIAPTFINMAKGKDVYTKFCTACHGDAGDGNGSIVANGKFPSPGKYWDKIAAGLNDGKMFHTITYGKGLMGSHASQINKEERWLTILYINDLIKKGAPATVTAVVADNEANKNKK